VNLGNAYAIAGQPTLALEQYQKAADLNGTLRDLGFNLGLLYLERRFPDLSPQEQARKANEHLVRFGSMGGKDDHLGLLLEESHRLAGAKASGGP
jgi:tetratricopeptide (TPR) repeat protein